MKTKEELNALKEEVKTVKEKLSALTDEELEQVSGGLYMRLADPVVEPPVVEPPVLKSTWY